MKRLFLGLALALTVACASVSSLQKAQQTHDLLAVAQDSEAALCWNVPTVAAAISANVPPSHCTAIVAGTVGWTDARHQAFNAAMAKALRAHQAVTLALNAGNSGSFADVQIAITELLALLAQVTPHAAVSAIQQPLQQARVR